MRKPEVATERRCSWCNVVKPIEHFYFVTKAINTRRGQCKQCRKTITRLLRDPSWRPPCICCGALLNRKRTGGRRLCDTCASKKYNINDFRPGGSKRLLLKPCLNCGGLKERFKQSRYCQQCLDKFYGLPLTASNRVYERGKELYTKYGISVVQYNKMLAMHNGGCWICGHLPKTRRLSVEHDHGTTNGIQHRVRGLTCYACNVHRIGRNTVETARKVLTYLESDFDGRTL